MLLYIGSIISLRVTPLFYTLYINLRVPQKNPGHQEN